MTKYVEIYINQEIVGSRVNVLLGNDKEWFTETTELPNCQAYTNNVVLISRKTVPNAANITKEVEAQLPLTDIEVENLVNELL